MFSLSLLTTSWEARDTEWHSLNARGRAVSPGLIVQGVRPAGLRACALERLNAACARVNLNCGHRARARVSPACSFRRGHCNPSGLGDTETGGRPSSPVRSPVKSTSRPHQSYCRRCPKTNVGGSMVRPGSPRFCSGFGSQFPSSPFGVGTNVPPEGTVPGWELLGPLQNAASSCVWELAGTKPEQFPRAFFDATCATVEQGVSVRLGTKSLP